MARFDLTDAEWSVILSLLPNKPRGAPRTDDRRVLNGIFWTLRTGSPWPRPAAALRSLNEVCSRYNRWANGGVWLRFWLSVRWTRWHLIDPRLSAHQHAAGGKKGARITPLAVLVKD
jgi:transposase